MKYTSTAVSVSSVNTTQCLIIDTILVAAATINLSLARVQVPLCAEILPFHHDRMQASHNITITHENACANAARALRVHAFTLAFPFSLPHSRAPLFSVLQFSAFFLSFFSSHSPVPCFPVLYIVTFSLSFPHFLCSVLSDSLRSLSPSHSPLFPVLSLLSTHPCSLFSSSLHSLILSLFSSLSPATCSLHSLILFLYSPLSTFPCSLVFCILSLLSTLPCSLFSSCLRYLIVSLLPTVPCSLFSAFSLSLFSPHSPPVLACVKPRLPDHLDHPDQQECQ